MFFFKEGTIKLMTNFSLEKVKKKKGKRNNILSE